MTDNPALIRILTVDDHALLRKGISALVNAESDMKLVAEASNGQEAIAAFRLHQPDVTLMDLQMPADRLSLILDQIAKKSDCRLLPKRLRTPAAFVAIRKPKGYNGSLHRCASQIRAHTI